MFLIKQRVELNAQAGVIVYSAPLQYGDALAHEWRVEALRDGAPVDLSGYDIALYARRADGSTAGPIEGTADGAVASVAFPAMVYSVEGNVTLILRAYRGAEGSDPAETATLAALHARVSRDTTDTIVSEEVIVPNISELLEQIDRMEEMTQYAEEQGDYAKEQGDYAKEQGDYAKEKGDDADEAAGDANEAAEDATEAAEAANSAAQAANTAAQTITQAIVPQFSVTVQTLLPEQAATASVDTTVDGTIQRPVLKLGIPRGQSGASNVNSVGGVAPDLNGDIPLTVAGVGAETNPSSQDYGNIPLTPAAIGAVPSARTVNGKALSQDIALDAEDVGALPDDEPHLQSVTRYHLTAEASAWTAEKYNNVTYGYKQTLACQGVTADDVATATFDTAQATLANYGNLQRNFLRLWCVELAEDQVVVHAATTNITIPILLEVIR